MAEPSPAAWMAQPRFPLHGVAVDVRSLYNVGALFRAADQARLAQLWLTGASGHPARHPERIAKTALGSTESVPWTYAPTWQPVLAGLRAQGVRLVALELTERSVPLTAIDASWFPLALVVGHETDGVSAEVLAACDDIVAIDTFGRKPSLNVALAFGIAAVQLAQVWAAASDKGVRNLF